MKVTTFLRNDGLVNRTERPSVISAIVYIIDQMGRRNEPITLTLDSGEIMVQGYGRRPLGRVCGTEGPDLSYEDVPCAEQLLAESVPA